MKRLLLALVLACAVAVACSDDTDDTASADDTSTDADADAESDTDTDADEPTEIEIPDNALDFTGQAEVAVEVQDNTFEQRVILVDPGTTVTWTNEGIQPHNVQPAVEGAFTPIDTGELEPGASNSRTFDTAGDYPYFCSLHGTARNGQTGRIIVVA